MKVDSVNILIKPKGLYKQKIGLLLCQTRHRHTSCGLTLHCEGWAEWTFYTCFFKFFFENFRRRSVRVLKLHRGFILTKKGDINPPKNSETPSGPLGGVFRFFYKVFFENFKICPRVPKVGYDFWGVWGHVWRWLCRHVCREISASVDGGLSGGSSVRRRWARTPIGVSGICNFITTEYPCLSQYLPYYWIYCQTLSEAQDNIEKKALNLNNLTNTGCQWNFILKPQFYFSFSKLVAGNMSFP